MLRLQGEDVLHGLLPAVHSLPGQTVNQIQGQIFKFRLPGGLNGGVRLLPGVDAVDGGKFSGTGRLVPQGQAIEPRPAEVGEHSGVHAVRICFGGDLGVLLHSVKLLHCMKQLF